MLELLVSFKVTGEVLFGIFSQSHSLSMFLINNPEYIFWLIENDTLSKDKDMEDYYKEARNFIRSARSAQKKEALLRHYRKREYLRIAAREIIGACSFEKTMEELSNLAEGLIEVAVDIAFERLNVNNSKSGFCVLGLGKLGNKELNFSSDIDLMFVHKDESKSELYNRIASLVVNILGKNMQDGFVFRVDTRLRPNGVYSPLSLSLDEYENYYATFGQVWEKIALLKARGVAGDKELGLEFLNVVEPFVFKRTIDIEYVDEIRRLMFKIYGSSKKEDGLIPRDKQNIKKGKGGIREIEFILNYFQLLYGGSNRELRNVKTVDGLRIASKLGFIREEQSTFLSDAYLFFRRIEHKIQLLNEQQTHLLPLDEKSLGMLAKKLGMSVKDFVDRYNEYTDKVHEIFRSIFILDKGLPVFNTFEDIEGFLKELGVNDARSVAINIEESVRKFKASDLKSWEIQNIFDIAFNFVKDTGRFGKVVNGFTKINPIYIRSLSKNKKLFELFLKLLAVDYASKFVSYPFLLDTILTPTNLRFYSTDEREKERITLEIILKILSGSYEHDDLKVYTDFARSLIENVSLEADTDHNLAIIGYGKLATGELFVGSDLDIVFVTEGDPYLCEPKVRKIIKSLGKYYEVDLRLRPFGDKGMIVCDIEYLDKYFKRDAQSWEKQAAQRSEIIYCGFEKNLVEGVIRDFVLKDPPSRCEIFCMLRKIIGNKGKGLDIKSSYGGLTTIDFLVQSICFEKGCVKISHGTLDLIKSLEKVGFSGTNMLEKIYKYLFKILITLRIANCSSKLDDGNIGLVEFLIDETNLKVKVLKHMEVVKQMSEEYFYDCSCN